MKNEKRRIVFVSAHPTDRYEFLSPVIDAIEASGECVAVYNPAPRDEGDTIPEGTELFVIIASVKYFTWKNSGYLSEYAAAKREGVPVLPIMIEGTSNTVDLINMRLGKLQYIDASENFGFAMDTLRAYLNATEREVDRSLPSVFISYRKADKPALYELVRIIGNSPSYSKINLWYDEIIAPGENYSAAIMRELKGCDLFILLVTPNVLERGNYVHRIEYKTARELGKRIIAVEAEHTDRQALLEMYDGLPRCVGIKQAGALYSVIDEIVERRG